MTKTNLILFLILILISLAAVFFSQSPAIFLINHYIGMILRPFEIIFSSIKNQLAFWQDAVFNIKQIKESNISLANENLELYGKLAKLSELEDENSILKEQLNLSKKNINAKLAEIIGYDFQNNRSFLIDKGTNDGISNGMVVVSPQGEIIMGKISDAGYKSSKVQTILDAQTRIAAITLNSRASGLVRGLGSDIIFDLIAKNNNPNVGELIISSGIDGVWPYGLIIGKIKDIKTSDGQIFNTADIEMLSNPAIITSVFIITSGQ